MTAHADRPIVLVASHLTFGYDNLPLFDGLSAAIPRGVTLVRGGDGRGKSTLLHLLAGQLPAKAGSLQLHGIGLAEDARAYRSQTFHIDPRTEAYDQLTPPEFFTTMAERHPHFDAARLPALIDGLSLTPHLEKKLFMLSTGSKRKVYLAAAFAAGAALTLLDDPFAGLDMASMRFVTATLNDLATQDDAPRAWVVALYEAMPGLRLDSTIDLGD